MRKAVESLNRYNVTSGFPIQRFNGLTIHVAKP
jgi:hypothetical protein